MPYTKVVQNSIDMWTRYVNEAKGAEGRVRDVLKVRSRYRDDLFHDEPYLSGGDVTENIKPRSVKELVFVLRSYRDIGLKIGKVEEDKKAQVRTYSLYYLDTRKSLHPDDGYMREHYPDITLKAFFTAEDGECKYVQVGTKETEVEAVAAKTVEEPIFELHCGQTLGDTSGAFIDLDEAEEALA